MTKLKAQMPRKSLLLICFDFHGLGFPKLCLMVLLRFQLPQALQIVQNHGFEQDALCLLGY